MKTISKNNIFCIGAEMENEMKRGKGHKTATKRKANGNQGTWDPKEFPGVVRGTRKDTKKQKFHLE